MPTIKKKKPVILGGPTLGTPVRPGKLLAGRVKPAYVPWDIKRDGLTQGFLENLVCPERLRLKYKLGLERNKFSGALKFGNVMHNALEAVYTEFRDHPSLPIDRLRTLGEQVMFRDEQVTRELAKEEGTLTEHEQELEDIYGSAEVLLTHYMNRYKSDFDGTMKWESLEEVFNVNLRIKLGSSIEVPIRGKIDGKYRVKNGRLWIMDHKTKSQINEALIADKLNIDLQVLLYCWSEKHRTGEYPAGVCYNVMRRPQLKKKVSETLSVFLDRVDSDIAKRIDWYFYRYEVAFTKSDIDFFEKELTSMVKQAYRWSIGEYHYRFSGACDTRYGTCSYLPVCSRQDYDGLRVREQVYPELVEIEIPEEIKRNALRPK